MAAPASMSSCFDASSRVFATSTRRPVGDSSMLSTGRRLGRRTWLHPTFDEPDGDHAFYTFAAAIRAAMAEFYR
jgi:hypothetical protein